MGISSNPTMSGALWADYSFTRPSLAALKAAGYTGVMRYLSHDPAKALSTAERDTILAAGLGLGLVFEDQAGRATQGQSAGVADATFALGMANSLDCPSVVPIFFAVDTSVSVDAVRPYFIGVSSVLGSRAGAYGSATITQAHLVSWNWQTVAWSGGVHDQAANLYQDGTSTVPGTDRNILVNPFPIWEAEMALTTDDYDNLIANWKFLRDDGSLNYISVAGALNWLCDHMIELENKVAGLTTAGSGLTLEQVKQALLEVEQRA